MDAFVFYISGVLSVVAAALVVTRKNPVHGTIYLVLFFLLVSLDYLILRAPFLAIIQVLVYAGAILVLFLFVIMLLNLSEEELRESTSTTRKGFAGILSAGLFGLLSWGILRSPTVRNMGDLAAPVTSPTLAKAGETEAIGQALFTTHALAFEFSSILILVAILGAIYLTKKRKQTSSAPSQTSLTGLESQEEAGQKHAPADGARLEKRLA